MAQRANFMLSLVVFVTALHQNVAFRLSKTRTRHRPLMSHPHFQVTGTVIPKDFPEGTEGIKLKKLPNSDLVVTEVSLGTLTYGDQINKYQSMEIIDAATKEYGINFLDTSEIFPAPYTPTHYGASEKIIGEWLKTNSKEFNSNIKICTKVCGRSDEITWARKSGQGTRVTRKQVEEAVDNSLRRLGRDHIDLLLLQWPERFTPVDGEETFYGVNHQHIEETPYEEQAQAMADMVKKGKVRAWGLANETPYGVGCWTTTLKAMGSSIPKPSVMQMPFNLLERYEFERGMMEACSPNHGDMGLFAVSPLAGGALTGKYIHFERSPRDARLKKYVGFMNRFLSAEARDATFAYRGVSREIGMSFTSMALSWVLTRPYVSCTAFSATSLKQLQQTMDLFKLMPFADHAFKKVDDAYLKFLAPTSEIHGVLDPTIDYFEPGARPWGTRDEDYDPRYSQLQEALGIEEGDVDPEKLIEMEDRMVEMDRMDDE